MTGNYRGAAKEVLPVLRMWQDYWPARKEPFGGNDGHYQQLGKCLASAIDAITNDPAPPELN